jgi:hypothetical protein
VQRFSSSAHRSPAQVLLPGKKVDRLVLVPLRRFRSITLLVKMKLRHLLAIMSAVATPSISVYAVGVPFPGKSTSLSPNQKWKIECLLDQQHEGAYALILENISTGKKSKIFEGGRNCQVLWSKDDSSLAITDWLGSNYSDIFILSTKEDGPVKQLPEIKNTQDIILKDELTGHCYWEAVYWDGDGRLYYRIFGHTDTNQSNGFIYYFRFEPRSGNSSLISKESSPSLDAEAKIYAERKQ